MPRHKEKNRGQVHIDGRITIPQSIREQLKIEEGTFFEAEIIDQDSIKIKFFRV